MNPLEMILKLTDQFTTPIKAAGVASDNTTAHIVQNNRRVEQTSISASSGISRMGSAMRFVAGMILPFVAAFGSIMFFQKSIEAFNKQEQAVAQLEASLKSTGFAAGFTSQQLQDQASALQKVTLFGDEATIEMQSLLLTFTQIKGKIFQEAQPAILDLATKMGGDLKGAAIQVGKALNDPIQGITALRRVGVSFSEAQQDTIAKLVQTNHLADAQAMILKELKTEFGGSAEAAAKAGSGPLKQLQNAFGDVTEELGGLLMKVVTMFLPAMQSFVTGFHDVVQAAKDVYHWISDNKDILENYGIVILSAVAIYELWVLWSQRAAIWSGIKTTLTLIETGAMVALGTAAAWVNATFIASPIGWVVLGVIALVAVILYLVKCFDGWGKTWDNLVNFMKFSLAAFKDYFNLAWLSLQDGFMSGLELIEKGWYKLKSLWDKEGAAAGLSKINDQQNVRAAEIAKAKGVLAQDLEAAKGAMKWEVHSNGKTFGSIFTDFKKKLHPGVDPTTAAAGGAIKPLGDAPGDTPGKTKADSINSGGQRSIVINIGKQIEKLEMHVMNAREGVDEVAAMVREALRRELLSLNGTT